MVYAIHLIKSALSDSIEFYLILKNCIRSSDFPSDFPTDLSNHQIMGQWDAGFKAFTRWRHYHMAPIHNNCGEKDVIDVFI